MPRITKRSWKPEEEGRLRELAAVGATLLRARAAVGRPAGTVRKKAADMGLCFAGVRKVRAMYRLHEPTIHQLSRRAKSQVGGS